MLPSKQSSKRLYKTSLKDLLVPHMQLSFKWTMLFIQDAVRNLTFIHFSGFKSQIWKLIYDE